jgi:hypothetical protein
MLLLEEKDPMVEIMLENRGAPTCVWKIEEVEEGAHGA